MTNKEDLKLKKLESVSLDEAEQYLNILEKLFLLVERTERFSTNPEDGKLLKEKISSIIESL